MKIRFKEFPTAGQEAKEREFELPDDMGLVSISEALQYVAQNHDPSLGYYLSCRRGLCACCIVRADGQIQMACVTPVKDDMLIEPYRDDLVVAGSVVDLSMTRRTRFEFGAA